MPPIKKNKLPRKIFCLFICIFASIKLLIEYNTAFFVSVQDVFIPYPESKYNQIKKQFDCNIMLVRDDDTLDFIYRKGVTEYKVMMSWFDGTYEDAIIFVFCLDISEQYIADIIHMFNRREFSTSGQKMCRIKDTVWFSGIGLINMLPKQRSNLNHPINNINEPCIIDQ